MKNITTVRMARRAASATTWSATCLARSKDGTFVSVRNAPRRLLPTATGSTDRVVNNMTIAKAMVMSRYRPQHTVRFMATTGGDFGMENAYYDWCIGSWYSITHTHPGGPARSAPC